MPHSRLLAGLALAACAASAVAQPPRLPPTLPPFPAVPESVMPAERREREGETERPERDEIETDRDSFTPSVTITAPGRVIFEGAYSFIDNRRVKETHSFPEALVRFGLTEWLEARVGFNYEVGGAGNDTSSSGFGGEEELFAPGRLERESTVAYGAKVRVSRQKGWVPGSALIAQGFTPASGGTNDTHFAVAYVFGWELPRGSKLDASLRYRTASEEEDRFGLWAPSVVLKVPVLERVNVHAEYFGIFSQGKEKDFVSQYFSPGVHYLLTDDLEVGTRLGWGLNDQSPRFFVNVGVGVRY